MTTKPTLQELKEDILSSFNRQVLIERTYRIEMADLEEESSETDKLTFNSEVTWPFLYSDVLNRNNVHYNKSISFYYKIGDAEEFTELHWKCSWWPNAYWSDENYDNDEMHFDNMLGVSENRLTIWGDSIDIALLKNVGKEITIRVIYFNN